MSEHRELEGAPTLSGTRARFESLHFTTPEPGRVSVRVALEWNRQRHEGVGEGEASPAGEMRASATATISALEQLLGGEPAFTLVGIKELRVFDHDLVAVLLHAPRLPDRRLIGLSIIDDDRRRASVLAVLNATNRAVGSLADGD